MRLTLGQIKKKLQSDGMHLFPEKTVVVGNLGTTVLPPVNNGKEYISGYYQVKMGNVAQEKNAFSKRNAAAKYLREQGFQTWTEPKSHMGGTDTCEFFLTAARRKS